MLQNIVTTDAGEYECTAKNILGKLVGRSSVRVARKSIYYWLYTRYTVHGTIYTVHGTWYKLHSTRYKLQSTRYNLHCTRYTVQFTRYTVHSTIHTVHSTQYNLHGTWYNLHGTRYNSHSTRYTIQFTRYTVHGTMCGIHYTVDVPLLRHLNWTLFSPAQPMTVATSCAHGYCTMKFHSPHFSTGKIIQF